MATTDCLVPLLPKLELCAHAITVDEATDAFVRPVSAAPPDVELSPKEQIAIARMRMRVAEDTVAALAGKLRTSHARVAELSNTLGIVKRENQALLEHNSRLAEQVERLESVIYSCPPGSPASEGGSSSSCSSPCLVRVYGAASLTGSTRSRDGLRGLSGDLLIKDELSALDKSNGVWTVKQQGEDAPVYDHAKAFPYSFQPTVTQSVSASVAVDPELAAQLIAECGEILDGESWRVPSPTMAPTALSTHSPNTQELTQGPTQEDTLSEVSDTDTSSCTETPTLDTAVSEALSADTAATETATESVTQAADTVNATITQEATATQAPLSSVAPAVQAPATEATAGPDATATQFTVAEWEAACLVDAPCATEAKACEQPAKVTVTSAGAKKRQGGWAAVFSCLRPV